MSQNTSLDRSRSCWQSTIVHVLRHPIVRLGLVVVLATPTLILGTMWVIQSNTPSPADLFMQSVVKRDGSLGWHQLCPSLQAEVPLALITDQAKTQHISESGQGMTLTVDYIGTHSRSQGGQIRFYVVTAHRSDG